MNRENTHASARGSVVLTGLLVSLAGGCAPTGTGKAPPPAAGAASAVASPGSDYTNPTVRLQLRERAITVIESAVRGDDAELRANAIEASTKMTGRSEPLVALGLADPNVAVRTVAAMTAGRAGLVKLAPSVERLVRDESPFSRAAAIYALAKLKRGTDLTPLADILLADPSTRARAHAAYILGELGDRSAAPLLRQAHTLAPASASRIETTLMQLQIDEALIKLVGDDSSVQAVRAALYPSQPEDLEASALAVQIIGEVKDRRSIDNLIYLASVKDEAGNPQPGEVRLAVASALAKMGLREGSFIADEYWKSQVAVLRAQSAFVYGETIGRAQNLDQLSTLLEDPDARVRVAAAAAVLTQTGR